MSAKTAVDSSAVRKPSVISANTVRIAAILFILLVAFHVLNTLSYADKLSETMANAVYVFGIALQPLCAIIALWVALKIGWSESVGRQWTLVAAGVAAFAIGDIVWAVIELGMGLDPYPSIADFFYPLEYVLFVVAIILAIRSYAGLVKTRTPVLVGGALGAVGVGVVYLALLKPYIFPAGPDELDAIGKFVSTLYPVGDIVFMFGPAITLGLVIRQLGAGRFAWPWWIIVVGALIFALTDSYYAYADWSGSGMTAAMDLGWISTHMLFACAVLVARDVYRAAERH
jgi:hypothetical protein